MNKIKRKSDTMQQQRCIMRLSLIIIKETIDNYI